MRGLQEAVCVTPPAAASASNDTGKSVKLVLAAATSSLEQTLTSPGWYSFYIDGTVEGHIAFYTSSGGYAAATLSDWVLPPGQVQQWYIDMEPTVASGQAYRYFKAFSTPGANLYWYKSSR